MQLNGHLTISLNKELRDLYRSPTTVRIMKSQRLEWRDIISIQNFDQRTTLRWMSVTFLLN